MGASRFPSPAMPRSRARSQPALLRARGHPFLQRAHHGERPQYTLRLRSAWWAASAMEPAVYLFTGRLRRRSRRQYGRRQTVRVTPRTATMLRRSGGGDRFPAGVFTWSTAAAPPSVKHRRASRFKAVRSRQHSGGPPDRRHRRADAEEGLAGTRGQNATLVFADSDWRAHLTRGAQRVPEQTARSACAGSRILVERAIYDDFRDAFVERVMRSRSATRKCRDAHRAAGVAGAFDKVIAAIARARNEGGGCLCGGDALERAGVPRAHGDRRLGPDCATNREESSGRCDVAAVRFRRRSLAPGQRQRLRPCPPACGRATLPSRTGWPRSCASAWS